MARKGLRLTILAKMGASSLVMLALLLFVGYTGYDAIDKLEQNEVDVQRRSTLALESQGVDALMYKQGMYLRAYLLQGNEGDATEIKTTGQTTIGILDQLIKTANMAETKKQLETLKTMEQQYLEMTEDTITRYRTGSQTEALAKLSSEVLPHLQTMVAITEQFSADKDKAARETMVKADQEANGAQLVLIWVIGLSAVLFLGVAVGIARHLSVPLFRLAGVARLLAEGDLTACAPPLKRQDEIGDLTLAFNTMVDHMRSLVADIAHSSRQVAESAGELTQVTAQVSEATHDVTNAVSQVAQGAGQQSHAAQQAASIVVELHNAITQVAAGAEEQAVSAQSSSEAVESMVEAINRAGELAGSVSRSAHQATQAAQSGSATVSDSAAAMERVRQAVSTSAETIRSLEQFSSQIGEITRAITEIADQTNLLALNAAIEAARAGEQGRGFSVVAEEVRKLAERSGKSASEIGTLVQAIVRKTADAVADMELATREVREGTALTEKTSAALGDIADLVARTEKDVAQIATATEHLSAASKQVLETVNAVAAVTEENTAATEEMAAGASQVTDSIQSIAAVAQENAASAEEVTASMEELTAGAQSVAGEAETLGQIAQALQAAVSRFKVG